MRPGGQIARSTAVGPDLSTNGAAMAAQTTGDGGIGVVAFDPDEDLFAIVVGEGIGARSAVAEHRHTLSSETVRERRYPNAGDTSRLPMRSPLSQRPQSNIDHRLTNPRPTRLPHATTSSTRSAVALTS